MKGPIGSEKDEEFIFVGIPADARLHFFFLSRLHLKHFSCCFCASETFLFCISTLNAGEEEEGEEAQGANVLLAAGSERQKESRN